MRKVHVKSLTIFLRLPDGWSKPIQNKDPRHCDIDGARLWISPGAQIYCDEIHNQRNLNPKSSNRRMTETS